MKRRTRRIAAVIVVTGALALASTLAAWAQGFGRDEAPQAPQPNAPYDGRFAFVRIRFDMIGGEGFGFRRRDIKWDHDYPRGERHFSRLLSELTTMTPHLQDSEILTLDDPELTKYPIAYMCEPGFWAPSEKEVAGLRDYLAKGGFIIFDDFAGSHWSNFERQFLKVLPNARFVRLDASHPIFDSFFHITSLDVQHPYYGVKAEFYGVFEDNDPTKRMLAMINYNADISEYWEWSDQGWLPVDLTNEAYKLGINYVVYAETR